ncbi:MAG TPA: B-box zinc finger protein [Planctomycetota bacterium]|nr:B-box zinc finger protein [Planctomycetota bacterium]
MSSRQYCAGCNKNLCGLCLELTGDYYTCKNCQRPCREAPRDKAKGPAPRSAPAASPSPPANQAAVKSGPKTAVLPTAEPGAKLLSKMRGGPPTQPVDVIAAFSGTVGGAAASGASGAATSGTAAATPPGKGGVPVGKHFKLPTGHMACRTHTDRPAMRRCTQCDEYICMDCTKRINDEFVCGECSGMVCNLTPQEQGVPVKDLMEYVATSIAYPFKGDGLIMLAIGGIFFWVLSFAGNFGKAFAYAFLLSYMMKIIRVSSIGKDEPPSWPAFMNPDEFGKPVWHVFLTTMAAFLPTFVALYLMYGSVTDSFASTYDEMPDDDDTPAMDASGAVLTPEMKRKQHEAGIASYEEWEMGPPSDAPADWTPPAKPPKKSRLARMREDAEYASEDDSGAASSGKALLYMGLFFGGLIFASIYYPMALLAVTLFRNLSVLNPLFVFGSIAKIGAIYLLPVFALVGMIVMEGMTKSVLSLIPIAGSLITSYIGLYLMMVQGRILGCVYWTKQKDLAWFL